MNTDAKANLEEEVDRMVGEHFPVATGPARSGPGAWALARDASSETLDDLADVRHFGTPALAGAQGQDSPSAKWRSAGQ